MPKGRQSLNVKWRSFVKRSCIGKDRLTELQANMRIDILNADPTNIESEAYICQNCGHYHVGRNKYGTISILRKPENAPIYTSAMLGIPNIKLGARAYRNAIHTFENEGGRICPERE